MWGWQVWGKLASCEQPQQKTGLVFVRSWVWFPKQRQMYVWSECLFGPYVWFKHVHLGRIYRPPSSYSFPRVISSTFWLSGTWCVFMLKVSWIHCGPRPSSPPSDILSFCLTLQVFTRLLCAFMSFLSWGNHDRFCHRLTFYFFPFWGSPSIVFLSWNKTKIEPTMFQILMRTALEVRHAWLTKSG